MFKCLETCKCSISNDSFKVVQFSGTSVTYENFRSVAFLPVHNKKKITIFINIRFRSHSEAMHAVKFKNNSSESFLNFHEKCEKIYWEMRQADYAEENWNKLPGENNFILRFSKNLVRSLFTPNWFFDVTVFSAFSAGILRKRLENM